MSLRIVIDMNLSPEWVPALTASGHTAVHWSAIGDPRAPDAAIMSWARDHSHIVFTHDLDFGTMLALTHATGPSVIQIRGQNVFPRDVSGLVIGALRQYEAALTAGALVVIEDKKSRVRILPL